MKKILVLFVTCFLVIGNCSLVTAQVAIGGDGTVATGAVLDLSQQGAATGGLLLPQVVIAAENANPFGAGESTTLSDGLLVYNLGSEIEGAALDAGLYVLQGGLWKQAGSDGGGIPVVNVSITTKTPFTLGVGNTTSLDFSTYPPSATYSSMTWNSSDTDVATVSKLGVVTGVAPGTTDISLTLGSVTSDPVVLTVFSCNGTIYSDASNTPYTTVSYTNAGLAGLCWMTSNLKETPTSTTRYSTNAPGHNSGERGYYYEAESARAENICNKVGEGWRLPTPQECALLVTNKDALTDAYDTPLAVLKSVWNSKTALAGYYEGNYAGTYYYWGDFNLWMPASGEPGLFVDYIHNDTDLVFSTKQAVAARGISIRCVKSL
ncbi:MAG: Ig-like domain-containing protein [Candidatus Symbiothrix sp.]|jgi:uncharacterized protein (TIGR02145 family)|nr:Ig-like domain-containing protein [Candidatus Symbiothrix sp.]